MTYCVGLKLRRGLLFMSDTRTNAGVDNVSSFRKMFIFDRPGDRCITILTAGNLATTQSVMSLLEERADVSDPLRPGLYRVKSMFQAVTMIGETLREVIARHAETGQRADAAFNATLIVGGQIGEGRVQLFLVYPEGNFIEASDDTPFFQIGETKYGRPILVRAFDPDMSFEDAIKLLFVSFDSTIKANLSVDLPLDLHAYDNGALRQGRTLRVRGDDPQLQAITSGWGVALRNAFQALPAFEFPAKP